MAPQSGFIKNDEGNAFWKPYARACGGFDQLFSECSRWRCSSVPPVLRARHGRTLQGNQVGSGVAGAPLAPIELIEALHNQTWHQDGAVFQISVPNDVANEVLRTTAATVQTNRFVSRLEDQKYFDQASVTFRVEPTADGRVQATELEFKSNGKVVRTKTTYASYGVTFVPPTGGRAQYPTPTSTSTALHRTIS